jgi:hypothetical protein
MPVIPWRPLLVFSGISVGTALAVAALCAWMGWTVSSPVWSSLVSIVMWAPALGRLVARRTVDRGFTSTLSLRRWGVTGAQVVLWPLVYPLVVYGVAYAIAWAAGFAHWSPGGGRWTSGAQIAANLIINLSILSVYGTFTAMGEEIGWHRARSLWPAVFFHSFQNTISQWLFPRFFAVSGTHLWLTGEMGLLPVAGYGVLAVALYLRMRRQGLSWTVYANRSLFHTRSASDT